MFHVPNKVEAVVLVELKTDNNHKLCIKHVQTLKHAPHQIKCKL